MTTTFLLAFIFSFMGSVPPGTINLSVLKMSVENKISTAFRFTLAAVLVELPYAWMAIKFQDLILRSPVLLENFKLITAFVLLIMGLYSIVHLRRRNQPVAGRFDNIRQSGFRKGLILGILNPMSIPFWIAVTAYLVHQRWISLDSLLQEFSYLAGIVVGTFALLAILIMLGKKLAPHFQKREGFQYIPGISFLLLGIYAMLEYFHLV